MGFSGDPYDPQTGLEEEKAYLFYTDHEHMEQLAMRIRMVYDEAQV